MSTSDLVNAMHGDVYIIERGAQFILRTEMLPLRKDIYIFIP